MVVGVQAAAANDGRRVAQQPDAHGSDRQLPLPGGGSQPVGTIQHPDEPAAFQPGTAGKEIFRGDAHSGRGGGHCGGGALHGRRAGGPVVGGGDLAGAGIGLRLSNGEHLAVLQLQGPRSAAPAPVPADPADQRAVCGDMVLLAAGTVHHRAGVHAFGRVLAAAVRATAARQSAAAGIYPSDRGAMSGTPQRPGKGGGFRIAIVGAASLKGKEVADLLSQRDFPKRDIKLLDDDETLGKLETVGDEVTFIQSIRREQFENMDFAFFAASPEFTRQHWKLAEQAACAVVDLSFGLENEAGATLRAPWVERELGTTPREASPIVVAHPAAIALGLLLARAQKAGSVRTAACTVFEPASER